MRDFSFQRDIPILQPHFSLRSEPTIEVSLPSTPTDACVEEEKIRF
jgi:hypothetical protein